MEPDPKGTSIVSIRNSLSSTLEKGGGKKLNTARRARQSKKNAT